MRTVNVNLKIPPRPVFTAVQITSRKFELRMGWGTVYIAKRTGRYWDVRFPAIGGMKPDVWRTAFKSFADLREWFKVRDEPYFKVADLEKLEIRSNFYDKYLLGDWDPNDYNKCSHCGAPVPEDFNGKCGQPCL